MGPAPRRQDMSQDLYEAELTDMTKIAAPDRPLRLGTRASPLALAQSRQVATAVTAYYDWPSDAVELVEIVTKGDKRLDQKLADIGGKGLFTEELEAGLHAGDLDLAVHSLKDLPTDMPAGLTLAAILPRAAVGDVLIGRAPIGGLDDIAKGGRVGTASLRRQAQLLARRPDLEIIALRGNIQTRLKKLHDDGLDAIVLAAAGLERMDLDPPHQIILPPEQMLPAAGQGALAVQINAAQSDIKSLLSVLHCPNTAACVSAERAFLNALDGSCRTPIAALGDIVDGQLSLHGRLLAENGADMVEATRRCAPDEGESAGRALAEELRHQAPHLVA